MKLTIKLTLNLTTGLLAMAMIVGGSAAAQAQSPDAIDNARSTVKALQQQQASGTTASKPAPGAPAPAVKPAVIPGAKPAVQAAKLREARRGEYAGGQYCICRRDRFVHTFKAFPGFRQRSCGRGGVGV